MAIKPRGFAESTTTMHIANKIGKMVFYNEELSLMKSLTRPFGFVAL